MARDAAKQSRHGRPRYRAARVSRNLSARFVAALAAFLLLNVLFGAPAQAQDANEADSPVSIPLTRETLTDALSCRSSDAHMAFATAIFLNDEQPDWMHEYKGQEAEGMIGVYGYKLRTPISFFGYNIDKVFFLKDWIVTSLSRQDAQTLIRDQHLERAPIRATEQYFRFIDPEGGPMLGAFEPTGNLLANSLAAAFGIEPPPSPPSESLFVGCNYTPASRAQFLEMAKRADGLVAKAFRDMGEMVNEPQAE